MKTPEMKVPKKYFAYLAPAIVALFLSACSREAEAPADAIGVERVQASDGLLEYGALPGHWTQDLEAARLLAAKNGWPLFLNFTGSDWCPPCKLMQTTVFAHPDWIRYAANRLVLVQIDFPTNPSLVPEEFRARNRELQAKWQVQAYPTFVLLDPATDKEIGRLGATRAVTVDRFIDSVNGLLAGAPTTAPAAPVPLPATDVTPRVGAGPPIEPLQDGAEIGRWTEDLSAARALATETQRPLLLFFTGSDWCQACAIAKQRVLERASFQRYARNKLILVLIDFPRQRVFPPERRERNEQLAERYRVVAFPSVLLFAPDGETLAGHVPMADRPHLFRKNIEDLANRLPREIDATASALGEPAGSRYKEQMARLAEARQEHLVLLDKASQLRARGGLTPEFQETLNACEEKSIGLETETRRLRNQVFAAKLPPLMAAKFLRLQHELESATGSYRDWLRSNSAATNEAQAAKSLEYQTTIRKVLLAIAEVEAEYLMQSMNEADADEYRQVLERLIALHDSFHAWLQTLPQTSPENNERYQRFVHQMQDLEDELDALNDGV